MTCNAPDGGGSAAARPETEVARATNIAEDVVYLVTGDVEDLNP